MCSLLSWCGVQCLAHSRHSYFCCINEQKDNVIWMLIQSSRSVSPLTSLFLDTQKSCGHGQPAVGPGKMSMWRCPSHCTWAPPEVLLLQGSSGSPHTVGLSELKSSESYPWVKRGLDFVPPTSPLSDLESAQEGAGACSGLLYLSANWEEWKFLRELENVLA